MERYPYTVGITPGDGLIARFGEVVMYIADTTATTDRLLTAVESAADMGNPSAAVAERLARLAFGADSASAAPFAVVAPSDGGLLLLLRGNVTAEVDTAEGARGLSGDRALTWVDEIVPGPVQRVAVTGAGGSSAAPNPHTDLRAGVAPGGGFVLCRVGAKKARPARAEAVAAEAMRGLEPTGAAPSSDSTAPGGRPAVETSTFTGVAGVLQSDDGAVYRLDRNYVIGRDPLRDEAVRTAVASPIAVHHDQHVSRVHAYVSIDGGTIFVRDASTPGGTFIAAPGAEDWNRIGTTPTELEPGWSLRVGDQILRYHT